MLNVKLLCKVNNTVGEPVESRDVGFGDHLGFVCPYTTDALSGAQLCLRTPGVSVKESGESADNAIATDQLISYTYNATELLMQIGTIILVGSIGMNDTVVIFLDQIIIRPDKTFREKILEKLIKIKHES